MRSVHQLAYRYGARSREEKWHLYSSRFPPRRGERVLDVGVSSMDDVPGTNFFLRRYPYPDQLVAVGLDDQSDLGRRYPSVAFVREPHSRFSLLHWLPRRALLRGMRALGHDDWPVWLLSTARFRQLFPVGLETEFHCTRMAGLPASLVRP